MSAIELVSMRCHARIRLTRPWAQGGASEFKHGLEAWFRQLPQSRTHVLAVHVRYRSGALTALPPRRVRAPLERADIVEAHGGHEALLTEVGRHAIDTTVSIDLLVHTADSAAPETTPSLLMPPPSEPPTTRPGRPPPPPSQSASASHDTPSGDLSSVAETSSARYVEVPPNALVRRARKRS